MITSACVRFYTNDNNPQYANTMFDIPCHRHADAFYIISQFINPEDIDKTKTEQGFLTHDNKFLNRYEAMEHAIACCQLPIEVGYACAELYSEDLW
jgi:hypothetical protein